MATSPLSHRAWSFTDVISSSRWDPRGGGPGWRGGARGLLGLCRSNPSTLSRWEKLRPGSCSGRGCSHPPFPCLWPCLSGKCQTEGSGWPSTLAGGAALCCPFPVPVVLAWGHPPQGLHWGLESGAGVQPCRLPGAPDPAWAVSRVPAGMQPGLSASRARGPLCSRAKCR